MKSIGYVLIGIILFLGALLLLPLVVACEWRRK